MFNVEVFLKSHYRVIVSLMFFFQFREIETKFDFSDFLQVLVQLLRNVILEFNAIIGQGHAKSASLHRPNRNTCC